MICSTTHKKRMEKIIFEKMSGFDNIHSELKKVAEDYLLNKEFSSIREAFNQRDEMGYCIGHSFYIPEQTVRIKDLPHVMKEAKIICSWSNLRDRFDFYALKATAYEPKERDCFG